MAVLTKNEIIDALERLGELAAQKGHSISSIGLLPAGSYHNGAHLDTNN